MMRTILVSLTWFFLALMMIFGVLDHRTPGSRLFSGLSLANFLAAMACYFTVLLEYRSRCAACGAPFPMLFVRPLRYRPTACSTCGQPLAILKPDEFPTEVAASPYQAPAFGSRLKVLASMIIALWFVVLVADHFGSSVNQWTEAVSPLLLWFGSAAVIGLGTLLIQKKKPWPWVGAPLLVAGGCVFIGMMVHAKR